MTILGNLIPEIESKPRISLVTLHSNDTALNPIGGLFLLEPLHPQYLGWMIFRECHESPALPSCAHATVNVFMYNKTLLRLAMARIKLLRNKRDIHVKQMRKEIAQLLTTGQEPSARILV